MKISLSLLTLSHVVYGIIQAPPLPGPHVLGTAALQITDPSTSRDLMVSLFYPTSIENSTSTYSLAPIAPPATALYLAGAYSLPPSTVQSFTSRSYNSAPILLSQNSSFDFPILLFSPGYGNSRLIYTTIAENIASLGYLVITVDHPFDVAFIEYENGTAAAWTDIAFADYTQPVPYVNARVTDLQFVLDELTDPEFIARIPGIGNSTESSAGYEYSESPTTFQTEIIGAFGHSLGGVAALTALNTDTRFTCGINLDGALFGGLVQAGLSSPFMMMANEEHTTDTDATWSEFWGNAEKLGGWKRDLRVNGTTHGSYTDLAVWAGVLVLEGFETLVGTIQGQRILEIESLYVGSFFGKWLKGEEGEALNGPSAEWPEVFFDIV